MKTTEDKTTEDDDFDYPAYIRDNPPDLTKIMSAQEARQRRQKIGKNRTIVAIDTEIVEQFKAMVREGRTHRELINEALREWLAAQGVKEPSRTELPAVVS
jgi:uncharacterized protein (DUF4415 family)